MLGNISDRSRNTIIFFVIFVTTVLNYFFNNGTFETVCICFTIGFALAFYFFYEKEVLLYILLGIFLATLISRTIFLDESILSSTLKACGYTIINFLVLISFKKIVVTFSIVNEVSYKSSIVFFSSTVILSILAGTFATAMTIFNETEFDLVVLFIKFTSGFFFGIMIFGTPLLYSLYYEEKWDFSLKKIIGSILFIGAFIIVASMLFSNTLSGFSFSEFAYILVLFYVILSLIFSYRMIVFINLLFVLLFQLFHIKLGVMSSFSSIILSINFYLLLLSSLASTVKMVLNELKNKNSALEQSTEKLQSLVYSTESLLRLSDDILNTDIKIQEDYLRRIFKIACNIFDNYDYASCYIKEDPYVNFISAVGYDVDTLMGFKFESKKIDYIDTENPIHIVRGHKTVRSALERKYNKFINIYPEMSESIRFGIYIDDKTIGGISFDITIDGGKKFNRAQFDNLKSFQKLMNSFFSINYLNYKNISLKNDIVLSLIRTLELFDQYTGGHSEEVAYLSNEISKLCGLSEKQTHDIYWAGVVHDIGKVGIDSNIINKPSKLSLEEYEEIKKHSEFGFEILNKAEDLKNIAILVKHHHEWWNGTGYPNGLKGDQIPFGSQIISVCDAVSTMAKKRPYTIVKTSREIIEELELYIGTQFAPEPTKAMIQFISEGHLDAFYKDR